MSKKSNAELQRENEELRREVALLRQKIDLLVRRIFGKSSEALSPDQLELLLGGEPEVAAGKADASWALESQEAEHEPIRRAKPTRRARALAGGSARHRGRARSRGGEGRSGGVAVDRCGSQRAARLRTGAVPAATACAQQIRAAGGTRCRAGDRAVAADARGALRGCAGVAGRDPRRQILRPHAALPTGSDLREPSWHRASALEPGALDRAGRPLAAAHLRGYRRRNPLRPLRANRRNADPLPRSRQRANQARLPVDDVPTARRRDLPLGN